MKKKWSRTVSRVNMALRDLDVAMNLMIAIQEKKYKIEGTKPKKNTIDH
jgi:hypothetical protein